MVNFFLQSVQIDYITVNVNNMLVFCPGLSYPHDKQLP